MCILKGVQGQCKPNAQKTMDIASVLACSKLLRRSLFSQRLSQKGGAKVQLFAHTAKQNAQKQHVCAQNMRFVQKKILSTLKTSV